MTPHSPYSTSAPTREEVDAWNDPVILEFGTDWCGHCQVAQQPIAEALSGYPGIRRVKVEDGPGRRLGRSFGIKLWPTLIFLKGGREVARIVRPRQSHSLQLALAQLGSA